MKTIIKLIFLLLITNSALAIDSTYVIKVHFLYGSKPKKEFKETEDKWFGGKLGGHVGIEFKKGLILDFVPSGGVHVVAHKKNYCSKFALHKTSIFYKIMGSVDTAKKAIVFIPLDSIQHSKLQEIVLSYKENTPYDYAFFGMRCGSAAYDILAQIGVLPEYKYRKTMFKIFYPKKLRKRLFNEASEKGWKIKKQEGSLKRNWEKD